MPIVAKLDELGKPAWIALMVLAFIVYWPLGLAVLAFVIWSGRMACWRGRGMSRWHESASSMRSAGTWWQPSSGNRAFDEYRTETLRRLEQEQREFHDFLARLRMNVELDHVAGNTSADGIDMTIDLRIIGGFVTREVAVCEEANHQQDNQGDQDGDPKSWALRTRGTCMKILLTRGQGPCRRFRPIASRFVRGRRSLGSSGLHTLIDCLSDNV